MSRSSGKVAGGVGASAAAAVGSGGDAVAKVKAVRKPRGATKPRYFFVDRGGVVSLVRAAGKKEAMAMAVGEVVIRLASAEDIVSALKGGAVVVGESADLGDANAPAASASASGGALPA